MIRRAAVPACLLLLASTGLASAQTGMLDLIPGDALFGIAIRDLAELKKRGDKFIDDSQIKLPLRPSQAFELVYKELGITGGLDDTGAAAGVLLPPAKEGERFGLANVDQLIVLALPFTDRDRLAQDFGFKKGQLQPDKVMEGKGRVFGRYFCARGKHLFLANSEDALNRVLRGKPAGSELSAAQRRALNGADILLQLGARGWGDDWKHYVKALEDGLGKSDDPDEQKAIRLLVDSLSRVRYGLGAFRIDNGIGANILTVLAPPPNAEARDFLAALAGGPDGSTLRGLPDGQPLMAHAIRGDGAQNALVARLLLDYVVRNVLEPKKVIAAVDRPLFTGVFTEVWRRLQGSRTALYLNRDEQRQGLVSLVSILDTADAARFLAEMKVLAKIADGSGLKLGGPAAAEGAVDVAQLIRDLGDPKFRVREAATTKLRLAGTAVLPYLEKAGEVKDLEVSRRALRLKREIELAAAQRRKDLLEGDLPWRLRPALAFVPRAEKRSGYEVDIVSIKLEGKGDRALQQLRQLFGPDWDKMRLVVRGKQVVVLLGSDVALLDTAVKNLADGSAGLAAAPALTAFGRQADAGRRVEFHLSAAGLLAQLTAPGDNPRLPAKPGRDVTSFALTVGVERMQLDVWVPSAEVRVLTNEWFRLGL
jgi:hypothetical protein